MASPSTIWPSTFRKASKGTNEEVTASLSQTTNLESRNHSTGTEQSTCKSCSWKHMSSTRTLKKVRKNLWPLCLPRALSISKICTSYWKSSICARVLCLALMLSLVIRLWVMKEISQCEKKKHSIMVVTLRLFLLLQIVVMVWSMLTWLLLIMLVLLLWKALKELDQASTIHELCLLAIDGSPLKASENTANKEAQAPTYRHLEHETNTQLSITLMVKLRTCLSTLAIWAMSQTRQVHQILSQSLKTPTSRRAPRPKMEHRRFSHRQQPQREQVKTSMDSQLWFCTVRWTSLNWTLLR